jgi:8-oxo-dGTP diphosphatase
MLITRRPAGVHLAGLWEFPGGKVEPEESLEEALVREIREELGIGIAVLAERFAVRHEYPSKSVQLHFFECAIAEGEPQSLGVDAWLWVAPSSLGSYAFPEADRDLIAALQRE